MRISDWSSDVCSSDLLPLGERLRAHGLTNRIGLFLHIPWPPTRLPVSLPFHERLVEAMLHYDVIGLQSVEWLESFLHYCRKELNAEVDEESGTTRHGARKQTARALPIGSQHNAERANRDARGAPH